MRHLARQRLGRLRRLRHDRRGGDARRRGAPARHRARRRRAGPTARPSSPASAPTTRATPSTLTERAPASCGADALLSVNPYYNRPNRRGIVAHYGEVAAPPTGRSCSTTSRSAPARTCPTTCSPSSRSSTTSRRVKQANNDNLAPVDGLRLYAGNDEILARVARHGRPGGILVASHIVGPEMRRMVDEPDERAAIHESLLPVFEALGVAPAAVSNKAALNLLGHARRQAAAALRRGRRARDRDDPRDADRARPARRSHSLSPAPLRVLPLGGLGEIGKNMTVVEYEDRIVLVDVGLRFPTAEMMGIDLVLPDFAYLRGRVDGHRGDRRHARPRGPPRLPAVPAARARRPRRAAGLRRPADDGDGALQARRAQALARRRRRRRQADGEIIEAGPFDLELIHMTHSIPDASAVALHSPTSARSSSPATTSSTRRRSTAGPPTSRASPSSAARALLLLCGDSTNVDRPGFSPSERGRRPEPARRLQPLRGPHRRHVVRVEHPPRPAGRRRRGGARTQGRARRPLDAQEHEHRPLARAHQGARGDPHRPREIDDFPDHKLVIISTGSQGEPLSALRRMAHRDHPQVELHAGDTVVFSATPIPGNERAVNETIDRLYHIGCDVITTRTRRSTPPATAIRRRSSSCST